MAPFLKDFQVRQLPGLDVAADWLRANRPDHFTPGIMHGDYQFANVMYAHGAPARLAALVDWEMTTIGDPLLDLAWALLGYDGDEPRFDDFYSPWRACPDVASCSLTTRPLAAYPRRTSITTWCWQTSRSASCWKRTYAAGVTRGETDSRVVQAFGPMVLQSIATAAALARSLPKTAR